MKNPKMPWLACWLMLAVVSGLRAQTAANDVAQGQSYLMASNLVSANLSFSNSVAVSPTNFAGNFYYAATRLLVLPDQPGGSNFLTRLGFPLAGRDLYEWQAPLPKDGNGRLAAPRGVDANEFTAQLRTNALPAIAGAITNLSKITGTNFSLYLPTSQTTRHRSVTVDYGDVTLLRAEAYAVEYFIYTLNSQNDDAQLTALQALHTNDDLTPLSLLTDYPQLLTFATTNDLAAARAAFTNAVNTYMTASAFIRARPPNQVNLFNLDADSMNDEADFRSVLQDLETSLSGPVVLALRTNVTVDLAAQFTGKTTLRSLLPEFGGNGREILAEGAINPKVVPDITFGGSIYGLTQGEASNFLGKYFTILDTNMVDANLPVVTTTNLPAGTEGLAYSQALAAAGGQTPYSWTTLSSLPAGLTLATNGVISGTPMAAGTFNFTVQVTDALSETAAQSLGLTVEPPAVTTNAPAYTTNGLVLIPAGAFTMGDVADTNWEGDAAPLSVTVSAFYMETNLVSYSEWQGVYAWAVTNGYAFAHAGAGRAANHPVQSVDWFDAVKWNNARSQQAGLTPVYYTDAGWTQVYQEGEPKVVYENLGAGGYRLPTEAEWEKAARGGAYGRRFPWGNTISETNANYYSYPADAVYDLGPEGFNAAFDTGAYPFTSPVGYFGPNPYGVNDLAGNVWQWCWDWYGTPYGLPTTSNPTGPASGSYRVARGGGWDGYAFACRTADRADGEPAEGDDDIGFRSVMTDVITGTPPAITAPPQSQSALPGGAVNFSVSASGTAPLAYQWSFDNALIPGATNATYGIASVQAANAGAYAVLVTNAYGTASATATLSLVSPNFPKASGWLTPDKDIYGSRNGGYASRNVAVSTYTNAWTLGGASVPLTGDVLGNSNSQLVVNIPGGIGIFNGGGAQLGFIPTGAQLACLADVNQDGLPEILAVQMDPSYNFQILVYAGDGTLLKTIQVAGTGQSDQTVSPVFAGDLNGDGQIEIVSQLTSGYGVAGGGVRGWEVTGYATGQRIWRNVVGPVPNGIRWLGTTNGNLLAGAWGPDNENEGADGTSDGANYTWSYPPATGVASWIRNYAAGGFYDSSILLPDLNGDGSREMVATTTLHGYSLGDYGYGDIHLLNPANGSDLTAVSLGHSLDFRNAAFGALSGGPGDELVVGTYEGTTPALRTFGSNLVEQAGYSRAGGTLSPMAVADLAGTGVQQVLAAYQPPSGDAHLIILSGDLTQLLWEGDLGLQSIQSVAVDALNQDGSLAVVVAGTSAGGTNQVVALEPSLASPTVPFTFTTNNGTITITGYTGTDPVVAIPGTLNGYRVTGIGDGAFYTNSIMASVTIPASVTSIGTSAFQYCNLTNVTISTGVTTIGEAAFYGCRSLTSVMIPGSVTSIGIEAFGQCTSMTAIIVDSQNPFYSSYNGVLFDKNQTTLVEFPAGVSGSYLVPSGVTGIAGSAFFSGSLSNVTISSSVTNIGDLAFVGGPLTTITVAAQNPFYSSVDGVLFNKNQTTLVEFPGGRGGSYTIPNSVTAIGDSAFYANYGLAGVIIPSSVISIGNDAFWNCIGLTSVTIGNRVTSIGAEAFAYCYHSLATVDFQGNAPATDPSGFTDDTNAIAYYLPGTTGWSAFTAATGLPAVPWFLATPVVLNNEPDFGIQSNLFGFTASWDTNASVVIQAATNLINPVWVPVGTNSLTNGTFYFRDPTWTNHPMRFYRLSAP